MGEAGSETYLRSCIDPGRMTCPRVLGAMCTVRAARETSDSNDNFAAANVDHRPTLAAKYQRRADAANGMYVVASVTSKAMEQVALATHCEGPDQNGYCTQDEAMNSVVETVGLATATRPGDVAELATD